MKHLYLSLQKQFFLLAVAGVFSATVCTLHADDETVPETNKQNWHTLRDQVKAELSELKALIEKARSSKITVEYAEGSAFVTEVFLKAATHDFENPEAVIAKFQKFSHYPKIDPNFTKDLPWEQLRDCLDLLAHAKARLKAQLDGKITLISPPDLNKGKMSLGAGHYHIDGRPVYPSTLVWSPSSEEYLKHFGRISSLYYSLNSLPRSGELSDRRLKAFENRASQQNEANRSPIVTFYGSSPARWMLEDHPEIVQGSRHFVRHDIDNPVIRRSYEALVKQMMPTVRKTASKVPLMHMLANEPHFATAEWGWRSNNGLSDHTMAKYRNWLREKYKRIETLNETYKTDYTDFGEVIFYKENNPKYAEEPYRERQINKSLRGGPIWYDWCRFNQLRANDWFRLMKENLQEGEVNPTPVTIKLLGFTLSRPIRDGGMDIEYLTNLQDVLGADLRTMPQGTTIFGKHEEGLDPAVDWKTHFAFDWVDQAMFLDFSKSISPEKAFYDSEWHGFSSVSWRHFNLSREYTRSAIWMAFMDGMSVITPWVFGRKEDGSFVNNSYGFVGELTLQPIAVDAFVNVMKELNAHADWLAPAVQQTKREFMIYYCEEAAIQDPEYTDGFKQTYQAVRLMNLGLGFTTPSEIETLDPKSQTVLVSPTQFIADASFEALNEFQARGGRIVLVGAEQSFQKNELGQARKEQSITQPHATVEADHCFNLIPQFEKVLRPLSKAPEFPLTIVDEKGDPAHGVILKSAQHPESGKPIVILNNLSKFSRSIHLKSGHEAVDRFTGRKMPSTFELPSQEVMALEF